MEMPKSSSAGAIKSKSSVELDIYGGGEAGSGEGKGWG
jgi:hypothetical protein